ncbi:hypothetical protein PWT90_00617 [Aphanocladium album]|nr:hypothetical protein PWT90_00617 [Aphanocladium album]
MESSITKSDGYIPPIPLHINTYQSKIRYKELVSKLVRIYQTYACSLSREEQLEFCRMMEHAEYEGEVTITAHKIYRQMFHYSNKHWVRRNITFARWAVMATMFFKPPSTAPMFLRLAKAVSAVGVRRQACFDKYKSYHETNLGSLELPDAGELSKGCDDTIVFACASSTSGSSEFAAPDPNTAQMGNNESTLAGSSSFNTDNQLDDLNTWDLYEFVKELNLEKLPTVDKDPGRDAPGEDASEQRNLQPSTQETAAEGKVNNPPATPNGKADKDSGAAARKHRLSISPAGQVQPPAKRQDCRQASNTAAENERRTTAAPPSGRLFFEEMEAFCLETNDILDFVQGRIKHLDAKATKICDVTAASKLATDMEASTAAFQKSIQSELEELKAEMSKVTARQDKIKTDIAKCLKDCSDISAGQTAKASIHAANTKRALTKIEKKQEIFQVEIQSNLELIEEEKQVAARHRMATETALQEMRNSRPSEAGSTLTEEDIAKTLEKLFQEKLVFYLRLHSKAKEEVKVEK